MIFLGTLFKVDKSSVIKSKSKTNSLQNQANTFQWNIINGLISNGVNNLSIISVLPVGVFPTQYQDLFLKSHTSNGYLEIGTINLPFLKQYFRTLKIKKILSKKSDDTIIVYSLYLPFLKAINKIKENTKIILVVTDLPEYYDFSKTSLLWDFFRLRNNKKIYKSLKRVDKYIFLAEKMKEKLPIDNKPYCVMEGLIEMNFSCEKKIRNDNKFIVTYCGSLDEKFGIIDFIKSFLLMKNPNIELRLYGAGNSVKSIYEFASKDNRIVYHGFLDRSLISDAYSNSDLLINPRKKDEEYTSFSFPSKTLEYLLSGIPCLMYPLDCIPDEYNDYINYFIDGDVVESIVMIIENYPAYYAKAQKGKTFVSEQKNNIVQTKRLIKFIEEN